MKRGESSGGGHSSLGYLFGSDANQKTTDAPRPPTISTPAPPPYGVDMADEKLPETPPDKSKASNKGLSSWKLITGRPSTKVKSPPGGDSSLGYLFGDKS